MLALGCTIIMAMMPLAPAATDATSMLDAVLDAIAGAPEEEMGTLVVHTGRGTEERPLGREDFIAMAERLSTGLAPGWQTDHATVPSALGFGLPSEYSAQLDWPTCDTGSIYVLGTFRFGDVIKDVRPSVLGDVNPSPVCGGVLGPTRTYDDVSFDILGVRNVLLACAHASVMIGYVTPMGTSGGQHCLWTSACASGNGVVVFAQFFSLGIAQFVGNASTIVTGDAVADAPVCAGPVVPLLPSVGG